MVDGGELVHHGLGSVHIKDSHAEGHLYQDAGYAQLTDLIQQRQIGGCLHLGSGIENDRGVSGVGGREDGQVFLDRNPIALSGHRQGSVFGPIVIRNVPKEEPSQQDQRSHQNQYYTRPFPMYDACGWFHPAISFPAVSKTKIEWHYSSAASFGST